MNSTQQIRCLAQAIKGARESGREARIIASDIVTAIEQNNLTLMHKSIAALATCKNEMAIRISKQIENLEHSQQLQQIENHSFKKNENNTPPTDLSYMPRRRNALRTQRRRQRNADSLLRMHGKETDRPGTETSGNGSTG
jgi:hypothetical protein